ncbi:methionine--tRNA ligase [Hyphomicrobium sp. CS1BSMeth3]|uniref:methionine--tRNA ligase n=1 Tax=Hyphomicrobium sp. CS1BSMeth3 TaxID=1892844 RepID=UPI0009310533|nr:methionine--tRNA ligase [Hyphomicrobium sp. CS1BSMeth3]
MSGRTSFYVTTPIYYPNGEPHFGHAYTSIACDVMARFARLDGRQVFFLTGTDEHGLKMKQSAIKEGITPQALADRNSARFKELFAALNISNDDFIRTTEPRHYAACQALWSRMADAGDIYLDSYAGWYSVRQEAFFKESETTVGPDGVRREPLGSPVEWTEEKTYRFRLSAYGDKLLAHYEANPEFILPPERRNEVISFVKSGLEDLSVSRASLDWGVPVPGDPTHVMYVWIDALTNYITAAGYPDQASPRFSTFWPADVHVVGKDILRFHAIYWPAFLMSAGVAIPKRVFAHGLLLSRGEKMSKSVGNVIDPFEMAREFGVDQMRYFAMREVAFGQDGNYTRESIINRINADLANDLGNLAQRSLSMIAKNCDAQVPKPGALTPEDNALLAAADDMIAKAREAMRVQALNRYLEAVWTVVADANRYFAAEEPWAKRKTDPARMATILYVTAEVVRQVAILAQPTTPKAASHLLDLLAQPAEGRLFEALGAHSRLAPGLSLPAPTGAFPRYVDPTEAETAAAKPKGKAKS